MKVWGRVPEPAAWAVDINDDSIADEDEPDEVGEPPPMSPVTSVPFTEGMVIHRRSGEVVVAEEAVE